jgi:pentatricopeptide repeat protein
MSFQLCMATNSGGGDNTLRSCGLSYLYFMLRCCWLCRALMNVAIKCNQLQKALEIYNDMLREGCTPNVVTYNTLIDVYGKTGQSGEALRVLDQMHASSTKPVTRTYNTLMIACNTSGQWQEALNVYHEMRRMGHTPNTTTYNALISAHSKAGRLEKVGAASAAASSCKTRSLSGAGTIRH